jgi:hypothetical protein
VQTLLVGSHTRPLAQLVLAQLLPRDPFDVEPPVFVPLLVVPEPLDELLKKRK